MIMAKEAEYKNINYWKYEEKTSKALNWFGEMTLNSHHLINIDLNKCIYYQFNVLHLVKLQIKSP